MISTTRRSGESSCVFEGSLDDAQDRPVADLMGGDVHRDADAVRPALRLGAGFAHDPFPDLMDDARALGERNEARRRKDAEPGMAPADQGLAGFDASGRELLDRLVFQEEFAPAHRTGEIVGELALAFHPVVLAVVEVVRRRLAALAFRLVERRVGRAHQGHGIGAVGRGLGDADARPAQNRRLVQEKGRVEAARHFGRPPLGVAGLRAAADDHHELVPADARDHLARADGAREPARDLTQELIPGLMAEPVIDRLEAVEVEAEEGKPLAVTLEPVECAAERGVECRTVGQGGQRVVQGGGFGPGLRDHAIGELAAVRERGPKQDRHVGEDQHSDEILGGVARAVDEAEEASEREGQRERENGRRHDGENERAAAQHADAHAGDDEMVGLRRVEEEDRGRAPDRAQRAGVKDCPDDQSAARALRQGSPAPAMAPLEEKPEIEEENREPNIGRGSCGTEAQRRHQHQAVQEIGGDDARRVAHQNRSLRSPQTGGFVLVEFVRLAEVNEKGGRRDRFLNSARSVFRPIPLHCESHRRSPIRAS